MEIAKFTKRSFSYVIDFIICFGIGGALSYPVFRFLNFPLYFKILTALAICYLSYLLFSILFMSIVRGKSFGSLLFGIKHVNLDGSKISVKNVIIKNLYLGLIPFVIVNAFYMLFVHTEKTIFDQITDTIVIDTLKK